MKPIKGFSRPGEDLPDSEAQRADADSRAGRDARRDGGKRGSGIGDWVVHKTNQLLAFNKPAALPVQTAREGAPSLQRLASAYAKRDLYLVHRIDQPASGLVLFGRHRAKAGLLQGQFADGSASRTYLAVVEGEPTAEEGELTHYLTHDSRGNKASVFADADAEGATGAKPATLHWRSVGQTDRYRILEVRLTTGRPHQVRAQLAAIGMPIHGDVKYGARRGNPDRSIHLHAWRLGIDHPVSGERVELEAPLPTDDALWAAAAAVVGEV